MAAKTRICFAHLEADVHLDRSSERAQRIVAGRAAAAERAAAAAKAKAEAAAAAAAAAAKAEAAAAAVEAAAPRSEELDELPGAEVEAVYVGDVYDAIAAHFSATRHSGWPLVEAHLQALPDGAVVGDIGCGNGKYMACNRRLLMVGLDRSAGLLAEAAAAAVGPTQGSGEGLVRADLKDLPLRDGALDHAICIAALHHVREPSARRAAVAEMLRCVAPGGTLLVTVWAFEQEARTFDGQDTFVPWKLAPRFQGPQHADLPRDPTGNVILYRYYHLFRAGELDALVDGLDGVDVVESRYDRDNWYVVFRKAPAPA
ncbi:tRNA (Uracil-5-)-methyltransferase TRM9 [Thecamonas trahens ATCC 50062]|uniref:tRNA (Uracil-5-)-methyltransferase TRM9 n=1 Tax=Thecamonas trahens ATCC 50062 TaxID=461836 RepID=A0A0L0DH07_THETB|nr:tRNA (Uracil-5-)-methyltransferase TRM9 [Thecamonas trahens ATCC 50062]KNC51592.1 tRNA (Uracil-5-)-methyltransferase TRM9 [Thecamonas trahens ATCC 50062]|eukprot:XP_013755991.1 tRNA (Uracil-5-)-methyltransferase TRM9 [Thecamonas trahens ATCC 50062]